MRYPGISFVFDDDRGGVRIGSAGMGDGDKNAEVSRVIVTQKRSDTTDSDPFQEVEDCAPMYGDVSNAIVTVCH